jgi:hypothetical protein
MQKRKEIMVNGEKKTGRGEEMEGTPRKGTEPDGVMKLKLPVQSYNRKHAPRARGELRSVYRQKNAPKSLSINILKTSPV